MKLHLSGGYLFLLLVFIADSVVGQTQDTTVLTIKKTTDFIIRGDGSSPNWNNTDWLLLRQRNDSGVQYETSVKVLYSDSGIYCLYKCADHVITSTMTSDFMDLWHEDVVEAFFWPDETVPIYFEYELSPHNNELPILVPNLGGNFLGWRPWHYEGDRRTRHATHINADGKEVSSWTAEFFIPFALLKPLTHVPPVSGTRWRANFYRIDHDSHNTYWSWQLTRTNFHDYERFGTIVFQ